MLVDKDISIHLSCQQFECNSFEIGSECTVLRFESTQESSEEFCPHCGGRVHVCDNGRMFRILASAVIIESTFERKSAIFCCSE